MDLSFLFAGVAGRGVVRPSGWLGQHGTHVGAFLSLGDQGLAAVRCSNRNVVPVDVTVYVSTRTDNCPPTRTLWRQEQESHLEVISAMNDGNQNGRTAKQYSRICPLLQTFESVEHLDKQNLHERCE
jgi:hypothetical protein